MVKLSKQGQQAGALLHGDKLGVATLIPRCGDFRGDGAIGDQRSDERPLARLAIAIPTV